MSTIYFQYTEGLEPMTPEEIKQYNIISYIRKIRINNITIPKKVIKKDSIVEFEEYLDGLDEVPTISDTIVLKIKHYYKEKFEKEIKGKLTEINTDIKKITDYIHEKKEYNYKKNINNIAKYGIHFKLDNYDLIICSNSPNKSELNGIKEKIQKIESIKLQKTNEYDLMEPKQPELELLNVDNYDDFNKDKIVYDFSQKNDWSLYASELYDDIRPK